MPVAAPVLVVLALVVLTLVVLTLVVLALVVLTLVVLTAKTLPGMTGKRLPVLSALVRQNQHLVSSGRCPALLPLALAWRFEENSKSVRKTPSSRTRSRPVAICSIQPGRPHHLVRVFQWQRVRTGR
jgi:hypothetical protein